MIRTFIVDDEPLARDELKYLLLRSREAEIVGEASNMEDALEHITRLLPDLVFLDIELSEDSGLVLAEQIHKLHPSPAIVFATAYDEFALQAFDLDALDYLLKPFDEKRIKQTLEKIKAIKKIGKAGSLPVSEPSKTASQQTGKLAIMADERIVLIDKQSIVYITAVEGRTLIKTMDAEYRISETLTWIEKKLSDAPLIRVHRSYLVNLDHISEIEPWFNSTYNLIMKDGSKVPVSRTYVKELKQLIGF
ncbi:LytR/AlgR family response regulator transcription factor [Peribacillus sp. SCS-155]|uniref:LytR/AlgR family response regulator transcription factor n=1 Tax=Peribacillus sedimenti TaxID=3115297 RepID=UPI003906B0CE